MINHPLHKTLFVAYCYYYASTKTPLVDLIRDLMIVAKEVPAPSLINFPPEDSEEFSFFRSTEGI